MTQGSGLTHGKTILLGEHAVVYGKPAIAFPVMSLKLKAIATFSQTQSYLKTPFFNGELSNAEATGLPTAKNLSETAVKNVLAWLGEPEAKVNVEVSGLIPPARGLGSSAAVAGAIVKAVAQLFEAELKPADLFELVQSVERVAHGTPSGLDAHATTSLSPIWFEGAKAAILDYKEMPALLVADTGLKGHTVKAVTGVRELYEADKARVSKLFDRVEDLTHAAKGALETADFDALGNAMNQNQEVLQTLGVSHPMLDKLIETARDAGALGAKLTGGGMGGCFVVLTHDNKALDSVKETLLTAGASAVWKVSDETGLL